MIKDLTGLDGYPWTGHSVLTGRKERPWQDKSEVLRRFHEKASIAVRQYREFVEEGFSKKKRPELTGGGLKRSAGGWEGIRNLQQKGELWRGDERILGDGDFVNQVLKKAEETLNEKESLKRQGWDLERLVREVCGLLSIDQRDLRKKGRGNSISMAKGLICFWGYHKLGINGNELARFLNISRPAVSQAIQRGEKHAKQNNLNLLS